MVSQPHQRRVLPADVAPRSAHADLGARRRGDALLGQRLQRNRRGRGRERPGRLAGDGAPGRRRPHDRGVGRPGRAADRAGRADPARRLRPGLRARAGAAVDAHRRPRHPAAALPVRRAGAEDRGEARGRRGRDLARHRRSRPADPGGGGGGGPATAGAARHPPVPVQPRPARVPPGRGRLLPAPLRRRGRPRHRGAAAAGRQGGGRAHLLGDARPRRRLPGGRPRLPRVHLGLAAVRSRAGADAADGGARVPAEPGRDHARPSATAPTCCSATTRTTPPGP